MKRGRDSESKGKDGKGKGKAGKGKDKAGNSEGKGKDGKGKGKDKAGKCKEGNGKGKAGNSEGKGKDGKGKKAKLQPPPMTKAGNSEGKDKAGKGKKGKGKAGDSDYIIEHDGMAIPGPAGGMPCPDPRRRRWNLGFHDAMELHLRLKNIRSRFLAGLIVVDKAVNLLDELEGEFSPRDYFME